MTFSNYRDFTEFVARSFGDNAIVDEDRNGELVIATGLTVADENGTIALF